MGYKPKVIKGKVKNTGMPIDGHVLYLSLWDYDKYGSYHLYSWDDEETEAVMQTMYQAETAAGFCSYDSLEQFCEAWKSGEYEPYGVFCIDLDKVEVLEVIQEEQKDDTREKMRAHGIGITPRKQTDRGGILCLPMEKNLSGDVKARHKDWELIECPKCGRKCWKPGDIDKLVELQGLQLMCTECALQAGLVEYRPDNSRKPGGNRAQRRRAKK